MTQALLLSGAMAAAALSLLFFALGVRALNRIADSVRRVSASIEQVSVEVAKTQSRLHALRVQVANMIAMLIASGVKPKRARRDWNDDDDDTLSPDEADTRWMWRHSR